MTVAAAPIRRRAGRPLSLAALAGLLAACGGGGVVEKFPTDPAPPVSGPAWWGFGRDAQHSALGAVATQDLNQIIWRKRVDLAPAYQRNGELLIHYGSPVITGENTVVLPIKTGASGGFRIEARSGGNGALIWSADSDYRLPASDWTPSYNLTLSAAGRLYAAGAGGKLLLRDAPDAPAGTIETAVFYGATAYAAASSTYDETVIIDTPITVDGQGDAFFGFIVIGANPAGLVSGVARVGADGAGTWVGVADVTGDPEITKVAMNSAPALSPDAQTLYVAVSGPAAATGAPSGQLLALDAETLALRARAALIDPSTGAPAWVNDNATASPTVGPDGDVFFGVLESDGVQHHDRGWLLHFDASLAASKLPGSFGWDDTASIVPTSMVPSYTGASTYLIMSKYNNYGSNGIGGDGQNRVAILDPGASQPDAYSSATVMKEVLTVLGPTADPGVAGGVREWCINSAVVDPSTSSVLVNSEDGVLYRWDLVTNQLSQRIRLSNGLGQAYTPTVAGADGAVYAISNATLFVVGH